MKSKDIATLREKDIKDLGAIASKLKQELQKTYVATKVGQEKNLKKVRNLKADLARVLTIAREKAIIEEEKA